MLRNLITISLIAWQFASADIAGPAAIPVAATTGTAAPSPCLATTTFVALDTETTGLNPQRDRVIEIGLVKFKAGKIIERKAWLLDPDRPIPLDAENVHGISDAMVKGQPHFEDVYPELLAFIKDATLLAHNAAFDTRFLNREIARIEDAPPIANPVYCTLRLCRSWFPGLESYQLGELVKAFKLKPGAYHRALGDAEHLSHLFIHATENLARGL
jgi:DNA polymerase-3 subunit alpha (Gram-positive type)